MSSSLTVFEASQIIASELSFSPFLKQISFLIASYLILPNAAFQTEVIESLSDCQMIAALAIPLFII